MTNIVEHLLHLFPQPFSITSVTLDEELLSSLLAEQPERLAHVLSVTEVARELAPQLAQGAEFSAALETAALFHDIGYAPALQRTKFHPLDGAIFLAHQGANAPIVEAVFYNSGAAGEAATLPVAASAYQEIGLQSQSLLSDALTFCDMRTSPKGQRVTLQERADEIVSRYGEQHRVSKNIRANIPLFQAGATRVLESVADYASHRLPWVFLDIDSTLVTPGTKISAANRRALLEYEEAGGRISLATGKHPAALSGVLDVVDLDGPHLAANGAVIVEDGEPRAVGSLPQNGASAIEFLLQNKVPHVLYTIQGIFAVSTDVQPAHLQQLISIGEPTPATTAIPSSAQVLKILCFIPTEETEPEAKLRAVAPDYGLASVRTSSKFLELLSPNHLKDSAMQTILQNNRWPTFHTIAIGDSENDLPLLRRAGKSVAVANASSTVIEACGEVTATCEEDGVARYLKGVCKLSP